MISSTFSLLKLQNFLFLHQNSYACRLMCQWVGRRVGRWIGRWIGGSVSRSASWSQGLKTAGRPLRFGSSATSSCVSCFFLSLSLSLFSRSVSFSLSLLVFARGWNSLLGRLGSSTRSIDACVSRWHIGMQLPPTDDRMAGVCDCGNSVYHSGGAGGRQQAHAGIAGSAPSEVCVVLCCWAAWKSTDRVVTMLSSGRLENSLSLSLFLSLSVSLSFPLSLSSPFSFSLFLSLSFSLFPLSLSLSRGCGAASPKLLRPACLSVHAVLKLLSCLRLGCAHFTSLHTCTLPHPARRR